MAAKTISAARGRVRPEVTSPFDSLTPIWYRSALDFFVYLPPIKSYSTFRFACKMPFENFEGRDIPLKKFFIDETPKGTSLSQTTSFEVSSIKIDRRVPEEVVTRSEKKLANKKLQLHHIGQTNPLGRVL
jgi:hypothetical protein